MQTMDKENIPCVIGKDECLCEIEWRLEDELLEIKPSKIRCSFKTPFGYSHFCTCPSRKAMHKPLIENMEDNNTCVSFMPDISVVRQ